MEHDRRMILLGVLFEGGLTLLAFALAWLFTPPAYESIVWQPADLGRGLLAALPMLAGLWLSRRFPVGPLAGLKKLLDEVLIPLFRSASTAELAVISLLAGLGEELLFRGVIQAALADRLGAAAGLVIASAIFGLAHAVSTTYAVLAALIGLYLGWLWLATGNLLVPITAHAVYDFLALVLLTRRRSAS